MTTGRPKKYNTDKERWEAAKEHRLAHMKNKQTIAFNKNIIAFLHGVQDQLEVEIGFRPTMQQAMRVIFQKAGYPMPKEGGE
jgi:hypothetical protein